MYLPKNPVAPKTVTVCPVLPLSTHSFPPPAALGPVAALLWRIPPIDDLQRRNRQSPIPTFAHQGRYPIPHLPPPGTLMIGFPVRVTAISCMNLRAGAAAAAFAGVANRGRTDEQHLCIWR